MIRHVSTAKYWAFGKKAHSILMGTLQYSADVTESATRSL